VKSEFKQDGPKLRATITSPASRKVRWQVKFEPARIESPMPPPVTGLKAAADYGAVTLSWQDAGADGYRVMRSDGTKFNCTAGIFTDTTVAHGRTTLHRESLAGVTPRLIRLQSRSPPSGIETAAAAALPDIFISDLSRFPTGAAGPDWHQQIRRRQTADRRGRTYRAALARTQTGSRSSPFHPARAALWRWSARRRKAGRPTLQRHLRSMRREGNGRTAGCAGQIAVLSSKTVRFWRLIWS